MALAEWIERHADDCEIGPGEYAYPRSGRRLKSVTGATGTRCVFRVHFPAGTLLAAAGCVIHIEARDSIMHSAHARVVLECLAERANELNPYRGRTVRATNNQGLTRTVIDLPSTATRDTVIVPDEVWTEVGARRGVLLCRPPGTGKSAVSAVVASEVVGEFTVVYVEAKAGEVLLTAVVEEVQRLGGPVLIVLEDVDLWCRSRTSNDGGLAELLQAMDIQAGARILTLASTNDAATLDKAAIRTGRLRRRRRGRVSQPNRRGAHPGGVDPRHPRWPRRRHGHGDSRATGADSGSDIREVVRRAVLPGDGGHSAPQSR